MFTLIGFLLSAALARADEGEPTPIPYLLQYRPTYFLMGNPYTKIDLSFKVPVWRGLPLYFGYSQLMMWDLFIASPFFYDINYDPEAFYRIGLGEDGRWLDFSPFEHESNGKGGLDERSWNRAYVRYHDRFRFGDRMKLGGDIKIWFPYYYNPNNADLAQYRGVWELNLTLSDFLGRFFEVGDLTLRLYPGGESLTNPLRGGQELTLRLKAGFRPFLPLFVGQIFHGYGEDLLDYNIDRWGFRAGVGF